MVLEYNILRDELVELVNEALELGIGWVPQGGLVYIVNPRRGMYFAQAMVREIGCTISPRELVALFRLAKLTNKLNFVFK